MKILHVYKNFFPEVFGGISEHINQLAISTNVQGIENIVLCLTQKPDYTVEYIHQYVVHRVPYFTEIASTPLSFKVFGVFSRLVKEVDLVVYHFPFPICDLLYLYSGRKKPSIVVYHSDIFKQKCLLFFYRPFQHIFLSRVDRIVSTSENYQKNSPVLNSFKQKVSIIPIGLDSRFYQSPDEKLVLKWKSRFSGDFFLFVGAIRYYKGIHFLLEAAQTVSVPIVLVGGFETPALEKALKTQLTVLKLNNVHFLGHQLAEDKNALLSLCTAFVLPSYLRSEAFGVVLLEASIFKKPLISFEIGTGTTFLNQHEVTGLVAESQSAEGLSLAMNTLLDNPEMAKKLGNNAYTRYKALFQADRMAQSYINLYHSVLN